MVYNAKFIRSLYLGIQIESTLLMLGLLVRLVREAGLAGAFGKRAFAGFSWALGWRTTEEQHKRAGARSWVAQRKMDDHDAVGDKLS